MGAKGFSAQPRKVSKINYGVWADLGKCVDSRTLQNPSFNLRIFYIYIIYIVNLYTYYYLVIIYIIYISYVYAINI